MLRRCVTSGLRLSTPCGRRVSQELSALRRSKLSVTKSELVEAVPNADLTALEKSGDVFRFSIASRETVILDPAAAVKSLSEALTIDALRQPIDLEASRLRLFETRLEELERVRRPIERKATRLVACFRWGLLLFLTVQFVFLFCCVFVWFSWDLVEPCTFFIGFTSVLFAAGLFLLARKEGSSSDFASALHAWALRRALRRAKFPVDEFSKVRRFVFLLFFSFCLFCGYGISQLVRCARTVAEPLLLVRVLLEGLSASRAPLLFAPQLEAEVPLLREVVLRNPKLVSRAIC